MPSVEFYNPAFNDDINELDETNKFKEEQKVLKAVDKFYVREPKQIKMTKVNRKGEEITYTKIKYIDLYGSKGVGHKIRSATNGFYTNSFVGSKDEDLYFVVSDSRGLDGRQEPLLLYFDSPEQYETHCLTSVPQSTKENWHRKFIEANSSD